MIAALFVETGGCYFHLPDVDPWDMSKDARKYNGPHRVIAHPPCERWSYSSEGGPKAKGKFKTGDDNGCFESALQSVRSFGGVLEHPANSKAWDFFGLHKPPFCGGWIRADDFGWTCCVAQGHYGHVSQKMTWLYAVGVTLPSLKWGRCRGLPWLGTGFRKPGEYARAKQEGRLPEVLYVPLSVRKRTPLPFRDLLLSMVRGTR